MARKRVNGIAGLTLREVAVRVGMQPPSLYSHFESKNAIYDAMFCQAWHGDEQFREAELRAPADPRERLVFIARIFFDFAAADSARNQLMNIRVLPEFTPSAESYAAAVECLDLMRGRTCATWASPKAADVDVYTALIAGLVVPAGGERPRRHPWRRLVPRVMHSYADSVGSCPVRTPQGGTDDRTDGGP